MSVNPLDPQVKGILSASWAEVSGIMESSMLSCFSKHIRATKDLTERNFYSEDTPLSIELVSLFREFAQHILQTAAQRARDSLSENNLIFSTPQIQEQTEVRSFPRLDQDCQY